VNAEGLALELRGIHKRFGATVALNGASLSVRAGTLHALLGENGAGKTTLMHVATGLTHADSGELRFDGRPVRWRSRAEAITAGLSAVHQHFSLVPAMTVAENVALGGRRAWTRFSARTAAARVRTVAAAAGLSVDPYALVADLPVAAQQRVEIVKAIANDAPVLMLDEPTAVLSPLEAAELMRWLRGFVQSGRTVVVITHRIREALQYADAVTVLRSGRTVLAAAMPDTDEHAVLAALLGEAPTRQPPDASPGTPSSPTEPRQAVLVLRDMTVIGESGVRRVAPTSLSVHAGEIVGVAGVDGGGQRELLRVLAGRLAPSAGSVHLPDSIGFVPEDRLRDAIIPGLSLVDNLALRGAGSRHGRLRWPDFSAATRSAIRDFDVLVADQQGAISNLSGGNQQKFVLARELAGNPRALIVENPTRGLDVRASRDILERLRAIRAAGTAVVVYSSDIEELLSIADRIVVCFAGVVRETALDADVIGRAMVGAA